MKLNCKGGSYPLRATKIKIMVDFRKYIEKQKLEEIEKNLSELNQIEKILSDLAPNIKNIKTFIHNRNECLRVENNLRSKGIFEQFTN